MGKKKSTVQDALMLTDKGYRDLKKAIAACTLTNFSMFIPAMVMLQVVMELLKPFTGGSISWTNMWIYFGLGIIGAVIVFLCNKNDYKKTYVASYMESENTRIALAEHIRKLPMSVFNSKNLSELTTNLMGDVATSEHVLSHVYPQIISNVITITVVCSMFAFYDWRMALAIFISVPVAFLIIFASRRIQERLGKKHAQAKLEASEQVQEYIEGIKVVKACNLDSQQFQALEKALRTMKNLAIKFEFGSGVFVTGAQMLVQSGIGLTVFAGTSLLLNGKIELVPMLLCLLIVTRIYGPIITELTLLPELFYHQIAIRRMRTLMNIQPMEGDTEKPVKEYDIELKNISFRYNPQGEETIKNVNVTIPAGAITALVGPSGSGKSTLSRLIARFWDVNKGQVEIGGIDVKELDPEHLMEYMSFVFQDVTLFNDTVFNNIRVGNMNATAEQVMAAAKAAYCDANGRIDDMRVAAEILKGRKVNPNVRTIIIPATQEVYLQCIEEGLTKIFIQAGAIVSTPTCGPCLGGHMGILAHGEKAVSTTNRNFVGRMGHITSEIYLASPAVAAASAVAGYICAPDDLK